ncbi:BZ3500_MvSof-1268-A1-R1_Chr6-3g08877 [Microbotryum saponariae]|uniref:BZ3500_MvSof-1268-A1-R1_Chr6-3g08877 protein n=1 Tax=Microbotryum saponariae TaxID=289078 RepID=A0A2X0LPZ0_9BASI|nr:BZ3500_MvSof-1268-A1-R1_Chr6-3g08877 [Microbotryum saponariae]SDA07478.1 BZ3501_MvSof-1269-A2-R1_Chr6-2g08580 [Microbotryum saponariae]
MVDTFRRNVHRLLLVAAVLSLAIFASSAASRTSGPFDLRPRANAVVPGAFILLSECGDLGNRAQVEQESTPYEPRRKVDSTFIDAHASSASLSNQHVTTLLAAVTETVPDVVTKHRYHLDAFCGLSIRVGDKMSQDDLAKIPGVKSVTPVLRLARSGARTTTSPTSGQAGVEIDPFASVQASSGESSKRLLVAEGGVSNVWSTAELPRVLKSDDAYRDDTSCPHIMTGFHKLRAKGLFGFSNVTVCVIDSGVDYRNEVLGGSFGPGSKIRVGYDFIGHGSKPPGPDPYSDCEFGFSGVAPGVSLGAYRVMECHEEGALTDDIKVAILRAMDDKCDVIIISVVSNDGVGSPNDVPGKLLLAELEKKGVVVVAASGNSAEAGGGIADSQYASAATTTISVGSVAVNTLPLAYELTFETGGYSPLPYFWGAHRVEIADSLKVMLLNAPESPSAEASTSCRPSATVSQDLSMTLVVIRAYQMCTGTLVAFAHEHGVRVLALTAPSLADPRSSYFSSQIYDWGDSPGSTDLADLDIYVVGMTFDSHEKIAGYAKAHPTGLVVNFRSQRKLLDLDNHIDGSRVVQSSDDGPRYDLAKPAALVSAPGQPILSTAPRRWGGAGVMGGTSMAAPFIAGASALLLSHRSGLTPLKIRSLFTTTSLPAPAPLPIDQSQLASVLQQGGGLIAIDQAYAGRTYFDPYLLAIGDFSLSSTEQEVTVTNENDRSVQYHFETELETAMTLAFYDHDAKVDDFPTTSINALPWTSPPRVVIEPSRISVASGQSVKVRITIDPPKFSLTVAKRFPLYSGYIRIRTVGDELGLYRLPFFGLAADYKEARLLETTTSAAGDWGVPDLRYPFVGTYITKKDWDDESSPGIILREPNQVATSYHAFGLILYFSNSLYSMHDTIDLVFANVSFVPTVPTGNNAANPVLHQSQVPSAADPSRLYEATPTLALMCDMPWTLPRTGEGGKAGCIIAGALPHTSLRGEFKARFAKSTADKIDIPADAPYRFLLRLLKVNADPRFEASWDSWLSPPFQFSKNRSPPAPA